MWVSRNVDRERARIADLSMSVNMPTPDPYRTDQVHTTGLQRADNNLTYLHNYFLFVLSDVAVPLLLVAKYV